LQIEDQNWYESTCNDSKCCSSNNKLCSSDKERLHTATTTIDLWPFVWDYPGEPVPEETFTHTVK